MISRSLSWLREGWVIGKVRVRRTGMGVGVGRGREVVWRRIQRIRKARAPRGHLDERRI